MRLDDVLESTAAVQEPSPTALGAGRAAVHSALAARSGRRLSWRHRPVRIGVLVGAGAAIAAAVIAIPTVAFNGKQPAVRADAAAVLRQAAVAAGRQPGGWPDAEYWHSVSEYTRHGTTVRREIWIGHHDAGVLKDPGVMPGLVPLEVGRIPAGGTGLSWDDLYALPTDSQALSRVLRADIKGAGPNDEAELFVIVGDLLRESPAPPALRRALYEVAAAIPGVKLVGSAVDSIGRPGTAVERDGDQYLISTADGALLQEDSGPDFVTTYLTQGPSATAPTATVR
jgi:hypothetical protein